MAANDAIRARSFLIAAQALNGVIGNNGSIPWRAPHDLAHFKRLTMGAVLIMGRATWDSLPAPLPGRTSIVITSRPLTDPRAIKAESFQEAIELGLTAATPEKALAFIGGARIYADALKLDWLQIAHITKVHISPAGDTFLPELGPEWEIDSVVSSGPGLTPFCEFIRLIRNRSSI